MSKITDYSFLFHSMFGTKSTKGASAIGSFQLSQLNSSSVQAQLRAAGIDTNSKQYKAAIKQMMSNANGAMYGNIQGIKNLMKSYDKDGDYMCFCAVPATNSTLSATTPTPSVYVSRR